MFFCAVNTRETQVAMLVGARCLRLGPTCQQCDRPFHTLLSILIHIIHTIQTTHLHILYNTYRTYYNTILVLIHTIHTMTL